MTGDKRTSGSRKFVRLMSVVIVAVAAFMLTVNFFADRYYVFHSQAGEFEEILEPNTRVLKAAYLEKHCAEFDGLVMGSSRAAVYRTADFDRVFGASSYNFGVATGSLPGILKRLEWLADLGCMPGRIFLPISIDRLRFPSRPNDLLRKEYPGIVGTSAYRREFLLSYLGTDAFLSNVRKLLEKLLQQPAPRFRYDISRGDVHYLWDRELEFSACPEFPVLTDVSVIQEFSEYLARIHQLASEHDAELILLWNPIPRAVQLAHLEDAGRLFSKINGLSNGIFRLPVTDERLVDGNQYHDLGHFKAELGMAVFASADHRVSLDQFLRELGSANNNCK